MRSLHRTLVFGTASGMVIVLCVAGILFYFLVRASLLNQFDHALVSEARLLASNVEVKPGGVAFESDHLTTGDFRSMDGPAYLQLWSPDGSILFKSPSLGNAVVKRCSISIDSPQLQWTSLPNHHTGRSVGLTFVALPDDESKDTSENLAKGTEVHAQIASLVLSRDTTPITTTLRQLETLLLGCGLGTIVVAIVLLWIVIRRILKPLDTLAANISGLDEQVLSDRIELTGVPSEIRPVVERLNDLLERLSNAFEHERSFSADVAHELRTPLAGLRSTLEVALSRTRSPQGYQSTLCDCLLITTQMQAMVENLLTLVRLDTGECSVQPATVLLDELLAIVGRFFSKGFEGRGLHVKWDLVPQLALVTDPTLLSMIARNILDNALTYTNEGGWIEIETRSNGGHIDLRVRNSGSRVNQDQVIQLFDRFWRADAARSATGLHCGLGLSLVQKITTLLQGLVTIHSNSGGEFEITVSIPRKLAS